MSDAHPRRWSRALLATLLAMLVTPTVTGCGIGQMGSQADAAGRAVPTTIDLPAMFLRGLLSTDAVQDEDLDTGSPPV